MEARREVSTRERPGVMVRTLCSPQSRRHCSYPRQWTLLTLTQITRYTHATFAFIGKVKFEENGKLVWSHLNTIIQSRTDKTHIKRLGDENLPKMFQPSIHVVRSCGNTELLFAVRFAANNCGTPGAI